MKFLRLLKSPENWIYLFSAMAAIGLAFMGIGAAINDAELFYEGMWLVAPLATAGVVIVLGVIPIMAFKNRKNRK